MTTTTAIIRHAHLFCGLGGGAAGFNAGEARIDNLQARFQCLGGIDVDPAGLADFERLAGVPGTLLDLFDRDQYRAWHGCEPPPAWREATVTDIHRAFGNQRPNVVFASPPCKGFSPLLNETLSKTARYQALNRLTLRGIWLALEAYADDPVEFFLLENVPRIATRGRFLLDQMTALLRRYGYSVAETTHDCGELGGLAQSRKRFLLVARHCGKVPPFLYEPRKRALQAVGTILGRMPLAGDIERAGPMHRVPALQWKTWVRLAFVEAGADWRSLNRLNVEDGVLRDFLIIPDAHNGHLGVRRWDEHSGTVAGASRPGNGAFSIADPRAAAGAAQYQQYGVLRMEETAGAVIGVKSPGQGTFSVADPRQGIEQTNRFRIVATGVPSGPIAGDGSPGSGGQAVPDPRYDWHPGASSSKLRVTGFDQVARTVTGSQQVASGALAVADPRRAGPAFAKYAVTPWEGQAGTVISGSTTGQGAFAVQDPRPGMARNRDHYVTGGHYGVVPWKASSYAVTGSACHDNGWNSVADPRMPAESDRLICVIRSLDGTWHRPFTTLELAALQSLVDPEEQLELDGLSDQAWRERIGNAVPPAAAKAIADVMGRSLLSAWAGRPFLLDNEPIWARPIAVAISLPQREDVA
jgi:site-specific DNA-cytosine methylase